MDLVVTPHPVTLTHQRHIAGELRPGESLYVFLQRNVEGLDGQDWVCTIGGREVPRHMWHHVYPKDKQVIELRGAAGRNVLYIVAFAVLMYFTWGAGGAAAAGGGWAAGFGAAGAFLAYTAVFIAGSMLINKVLGPKVDNGNGGGRQADSVYSIGAARNAIRLYEPLPLLFGSVRIAPDYASLPYSYYGGNEQYVVLILTPGINVDRIEPLYNNDTAIDTYDGVSIFYNGFSGMPSTAIPVMTNVDTINGGTVEPGEYVQRTTSPNTVNIILDFEYIIFSTTDKGKPRYNSTLVNCQYREVGEATWHTLGQLTVGGSDQTQRRRSLQIKVDPGQYEVRVTRSPPTFSGTGSQDVVNWTTLRSAQPDEATYTGIPRVCVILKATGQLNGYPDELRTVAHAKPMPIWNGSAWETATDRASGLSNPGAQLLQYARGFYAFDEDSGQDVLVGGMGLPDSMIDIQALQGFMLHCEANGFTYDNYIKDARSHQAICDAIALAGMGQITWSGGRFSISWAADGQPLTAVVNMATIKKAQFQVDYTLAEAADGIEYSFYDRTTWETKTIRVPAPGVETMLKPAQLSGEGVTTEAHAAILARYHLAQSLYQYKDIAYDTDIEHLTYRRLSVLALQHDMTKWGKGGRIVSASIDAGKAVLTLDEPVTYPPSPNQGYIGVRIPGEKVYRVFEIQPFAGESNQVTTVSNWPGDAPLPGNADGNPAHDTIWIYDFKSTPGYRVRVVSLTPNDGLKGASVAVVPEPPEFWTYVMTGEYIPPPVEVPVDTKPIASNLVLSEIRVVQGNVIATDIACTFDISGLLNYAEVWAALGDNEFELVATTATRSARWSVAEPGTYNVIVRPFDADGNLGGVVGGQITTSGASLPPRNVDTFDVVEEDGGLRKYTWAFTPGTIVPADLAGVEIRYITGHIGAPVWEDMLPVGDDGFFTSAFESVEPESGDWTFAIRTRNTYGALSDDYMRIFKTLGGNLGEQIDDIHQTTDEIIAEFNEQAAQLAEVVADLSTINDAIGASEYDPARTYPAGAYVKYSGRLYRAKVETTGHLPTDPAYWDDIGIYDSALDAQAAAIDTLTTEVNELDGEVTALATQVTEVGAQLNSIGNDNLIQNASFDTFTVGQPLADAWFAGNSGVTAPVYSIVDSPMAGSTKAQHADFTALAINAYIDVRTATPQRFKVNPGKKHGVSVYMRSGFGLRVHLLISWYDSAGAFISTMNLNDVITLNPAFQRATWITPESPANAATAIIYCRAQNLTGAALGVGYIEWDNAMVQEGGVITTWTIGAGPTSQSNASAMSALDARVTTAEGQITAQGTAITNVQVSLRPSANLIYNPSAANGSNGWDFIGTSGSTFAAVNEFFSKTGTIFRFGPYASGVLIDVGVVNPTAQQIYIPSSGGRQFTFSADMFWHSNAGVSPPKAEIRWYNSSHVEIDASNRPSVSPTATNAWQRVSVTGTSPVGTAYAAVNCRHTSTTTSSNAYFGFTNLKFESGTVATPFSDDKTVGNTASATQALEVRATSLENGQATLFARYTVVLNVNGYISGIRSENTGNTSTFDVMAANFRILDPSGGARTEYSNGNWRVYDGSNVLRVRMGVW